MRILNSNFFYVILSLFLFSHLSYANDQEEKDLKDNSYTDAISIYLDNDLFSSNNDRDYTGGFALVYSGDDANDHPFSIDGILTWINRKLDFEDKDTTLATPIYTCEVGLNVFTPEDIELEEAINDDRPYSNLLYLANGQQSLSLNDSLAWISSFTIGVLGTDTGSSIQNSIHKAIGSEKARGWDHQISEGGELTFKYELTRLKNIEAKEKYYHLIQSSRISIGFLTEITAGYNFRLGKLRSPWWALGVGQNRLGSKTNPTVLKSQKKEKDSYLFTGFELKGRLYNVFYQGQFRTSDVTFDKDDMRPFLLEAWLGYSQEINSRLRATYVFRYQTSEVKRGLADRDFTWGGLLVTYSIH